MSDAPSTPEPIHRDPQDPEGLRLRALVEEGLPSGPGTPMTQSDWAALEVIADGDTACSGSSPTAS